MVYLIRSLLVGCGLCVFTVSFLATPAQSQELSFAKLRGDIVRVENEFEYYSVIGVPERAEDLLALATDSKTYLTLPVVGNGEGLRAIVDSIDLTTVFDRSPVISGVIIDPRLEEEVGTFIYSHIEGSHPYLAVFAGPDSYELFEDGSTEEIDFVLRRQTDPIFRGVTDPDADALLESLGLTANKTVLAVSDTRSLSSSGQGCVIDVGVGYTQAAILRNGSFVSAIGSWMSNLNSLIDDIGVTCNYHLLGIKRFPSHVESTVADPTFGTALVPDLNAITSNSNIISWKNSTIGADIFIMIQSAAITAPQSGTAGDIFHGAMLQQYAAPSCQTTYGPNSRCGEYGIARDSYALSIGVFAHEILHAAGIRHSYSYGNDNPSLNYGGPGFSSPFNGSEESLTGGGLRSTTIMGNPPINTMCSVSSSVVDSSICANRLPFIASRNKARLVQTGTPGSGTSYVVRYFPEFYPAHNSQTPYTSPPHSMNGAIQSGMSFNAIMQFRAGGGIWP